MSAKAKRDETKSKITTALSAINNTNNNNSITTNIKKTKVKMSNDDKLDKILKYIHRKFIEPHPGSISYDLFLSSLHKDDLITAKFLKRDEIKAEAEKLKIFNVNLPKFYINKYYEDVKEDLRKQYPEFNGKGLRLLQKAKEHFEKLDKDDQNDYINIYKEELAEYLKDQYTNNPFFVNSNGQFIIEIDSRNGKPKIVPSALINNNNSKSNNNEEKEEININNDDDDNNDDGDNEEEDDNNEEKPKVSSKKSTTNKSSKSVKKTTSNKSKKNDNEDNSENNDDNDNESNIENDEEDKSEEIKEILEKNKKKSVIKHNKKPKGLKESVDINLDDYT